MKVTVVLQDETVGRLELDSLTNVLGTVHTVTLQDENGKKSQKEGIIALILDVETEGVEE